jgi:hypothetical protein
MIITLEILVETLEEAVILDKVGKITIPILIWVVVDLIKTIILPIIITCQIIITKVEIWVVVVDKEDKEIGLEDKVIGLQIKAVRMGMEAKELKVIILQILIPFFNNSVNIIIKHNVNTQINVRGHMLLQKMIA